MSDYPATVAEAVAYLAMRPVERWKVTTTPDGAMERCADLLAAEVERLTAQLDAISEDGTADLEAARAIREENRALKAQLAGMVPEAEARRRERAAADWAASSVVTELSWAEYHAARDARYPEVSDGPH